MRNLPRQRFTLLDAMVLVAGFAVGLGLVRGLSPNQFLLRYDPVGPMNPNWGRPWSPREWASWGVHTAQNRFNYLMPLLATFTVAVLMIRLRPPRPRLSRLMRQPGTVAMVVTSAMTVVWVSFLAILTIRKQLDQMSNQIFYMVMVASIATAVASSWITLFIGGRWRADPGWSDRLGRFLGSLWIAAFLLWVYRCFI